MASDYLAVSRVGFIGLGAMGESMAGHLHAKGLLAVVGNRTQAKAEKLAAQWGVTSAKTPADFAECQAVVLCVSQDTDVLQCVQQLAGVLAAGALVIDHSTVARETAIQAGRLLAERGIAFLDAPVSGGVEGARNGQLSVMVGGDAHVLARAQTLLSAYAKRVTHMGQCGAGQATKAVNQVLVAGIAQAVCEGLAFGEALGLNADSLVPTLAAGAAGNWFLDKRGATMMAESYTPGFKSELLLKDLHIVQAMATALGKEYSVVEQSLRDYQALCDAGFGAEDTSALIRLKR
jgi:3-hydroxyisobutyrate dehydrogenase